MNKDKLKEEFVQKCFDSDGTGDYFNLTGRQANAVAYWWLERIEKAIEQERQEWLKGHRCHQCGNVQENPMSDMCSRCFEEA